MELDFLFTRTLRTLSLDVTRSPVGSSPSTLGQSLKNIRIVQVFTPTSHYDDNEKEEFYNQPQNVIDKTPKKDVLVVQVDWNAKVC